MGKHDTHNDRYASNVFDNELYPLPITSKASKAGSMTAAETVKYVDLCQQAYNRFYERCKDKTGLPAPLVQGSLVLNIGHSVKDHASNEKTRVQELSKMKKARAEELRADLAHLVGEEEYNATACAAITMTNCNHHKLMLLAKAIRDADHQFLKGILPEERDLINRFK